MNSIKIVHLNDMEVGLAEELSQILNEDIKLQNALGSKKIKTTGTEFIASSKQWALSKNADMFVIILDNHAIGTISLSHQDSNNRKARIGYWICSACWGNGYASQAFSNVLNYARHKGIAYVSASIVEDNIASKRIWQKYGANVLKSGNRFHVSIHL